MGSTFTRFSWRNRLVAIIAGVAILAMPVEVALPDIHDDDGAAASATAQSDADRSERPAPEAPLSSHSVHVDHCAHGHLLATTESVSPGVMLSGDRRPISAVASAPPAVFTAPRLRPPIG